MTVMDPAIKRDWVASLRSDEYQQGRGYLRTADGGWCCLGVLCDLYHKTHPEAQWKEFSSFWSIEGQESLPPDKVWLWAGLNPYDLPEVTIDGIKSGLAQFNDGTYARHATPKTFKQIAIAIEEQL